MRPTPIVFDWIQPINRRARARKTDPSTSHAAAARVELGKAERQRKIIKATLQMHGPLTCEELGDGAWDYILNCPIGKIDATKRISEIAGIQPTGERRNGFQVWGLI